MEEIGEGIFSRPLPSLRPIPMLYAVRMNPEVLFLNMIWYQVDIKTKFNGIDI